MWRVREEGGSAVRMGDSLGRADSRVGRLRMSVLDQLTRRCHEATEWPSHIKFRAKEWAESQARESPVRGKCLKP